MNASDKPEKKFEDAFNMCKDCELDKDKGVDGMSCWINPKGNCQKIRENLEEKISLPKGGWTPEEGGDDNKPTILGHVVLDNQEVDRIADAVVDRMTFRITTILKTEFTKLALRLARDISNTPLYNDRVLTKEEHAARLETIFEMNKLYNIGPCLNDEPYFVIDKVELFGQPNIDVTSPDFDIISNLPGRPNGDG